MRYSRALPKDFEQLFLQDNPLRFIVDRVLHPDSHTTDKALDLQLREDRGAGGKVTLYRGGTAILNIQFDRQASELKLSAHKEYQEQFQRLGLSLSYDKDSERLRAEITDYLKNVSVREHHLLEGGCENWLSHRYGSEWKTGEEWVAVDREVVIGYKDMAEKKAVWGPIKERFNKFGGELPERMLQPPFNTRVQKKMVGNELDCLLWQPSTGKLLITEVKDGSDAAGVYLSPIQVAAYLAAWRRFVEKQEPDALKGVRSLIEQKIRLGLIPKGVLLPKRISINDLRPAIIIQNPNHKSTCWKTMDGIIKLLKEAKEMPVRLDDLGLWAVEDGALTEITDTWQKWAVA
jgi:hypothetical protein